MSVSVEVFGVLAGASNCNQLLIQGVPGRETQKVTAVVTSAQGSPIRAKVVFSVSGTVLSLRADGTGGPGSDRLTSAVFTVPANGSCAALAYATARDEGPCSVTATVIDDVTGAVLCEGRTVLTVASDIVIHAPDGGIYVIPGQAWAQTTPLTTTPATGEVTQLQTQRTSNPTYRAVYDNVASAIALGATNVLVTAPPERKPSTVACFILNLSAYQPAPAGNP